MMDLTFSPNMAAYMPRAVGFFAKTFYFRALIASLGILLPNPATAQTFTNLHRFSASEGSFPYGRLLLSSNILYGALSFGGSSGNGTVFKMNPDGTGFTNLHSFAATSGSSALTVLEVTTRGLYPTAV